MQVRPLSRPPFKELREQKPGSDRVSPNAAIHLRHARLETVFPGAEKQHIHMRAHVLAASAECAVVLALFDFLQRRGQEITDEIQFGIIRGAAN